MKRHRAIGKRLCVLMLVLFPVVTTSGCRVLLWPLMLVNGVPKVKAEFDELEGKRVAVVCVSSSSSYGPDSTTEVLARELESNLSKEIDGIEFVERQTIHRWIDSHEWTQGNYRQIGQAVRADVVLAVELSSYSLHAGQTLYKGKADVDVSVYDMTNRGKRVYHHEIPEFHFPTHGEYPAISLSQGKFERTFIHVLAQEIGNLFHDYEMPSRIARDRAL